MSEEPGSGEWSPEQSREQELREQIEHNPKDIDALTELWEILVKQQRWDCEDGLAIRRSILELRGQELREQIRQNPKDIDAHTQLWKILFKQHGQHCEEGQEIRRRSFELCEEELREEIKQNPKDIAAFAALYVLLARQEIAEQGLEIWEDWLTVEFAGGCIANLARVEQCLEIEHKILELSVDTSVSPSSLLLCWQRLAWPDLGCGLDGNYMWPGYVWPPRIKEIWERMRKFRSDLKARKYVQDFKPHDPRSDSFFEIEFIRTWVWNGLLVYRPIDPKTCFIAAWTRFRHFSELWFNEARWDSGPISHPEHLDALFDFGLKAVLGEEDIPDNTDFPPETSLPREYGGLGLPPVEKMLLFIMRAIVHLSCEMVAERKEKSWFLEELFGDDYEDVWDNHLAVESDKMWSVFKAIDKFVQHQERFTVIDRFKALLNPAMRVFVSDIRTKPKRMQEYVRMVGAIRGRGDENWLWGDRDRYEQVVTDLNDILSLPSTSADKDTHHYATTEESLRTSIGSVVWDALDPVTHDYLVKAEMDFEMRHLFIEPRVIGVCLMNYYHACQGEYEMRIHRPLEKSQRAQLMKPGESLNAESMKRIQGTAKEIFKNPDQVMMVFNLLENLKKRYRNPAAHLSPVDLEQFRKIVIQDNFLKRIVESSTLKDG